MRDARFLALLGLLALAGLGLVLGILHAAGVAWPGKFADTWKDVIELCVTVGGFGLTIASLLMLRSQLQQQQKQRLEEYERTRRVLALDLDARLDALSDRRDRVQAAFRPVDYRDKPVPATLVVEQLETNPNLREDLHRLLDFFETLALTVYADAIHERTAFELTSGILVGYADRFLEYIKYKRDELGRPRLYLYLERLAERWKRRRQQEAGQEPFFARFEKPWANR